MWVLPATATQNDSQRYPTQTEKIEMSTKTSSQFKGKVRDDYLELVLNFPLASLKSERQLREAQAVLDEVLAKGKLSIGEEMYLDALSDLVASYEDAHYPIEPASDADMLRHLMEAKGVTQAELHRDTGLAKSSISEVLTGRKTFSRQMIHKLAEYFKVDVSVLTSNI
jgi:HTH-type transcriptional regulator / antitoxin HigA